MKQYGQVDFKLLHKSGLDVMQWLFLQQIAFLSNGSASRKINGWVIAKQKTIADHLGISDRTIRTYINSLSEGGWLEKDENTKMIRTSQKWHDLQSWKKDDEVEEVSKESGNNFQPKTENSSAPTIKGELEGRVEDKKPSKKEIVCNDPEIVIVEDEEEGSLSDFENFWSNYPNKKNKGVARMSFYKAVKKISLEIMIAAVVKQEQSEQWKKENGKYIPRPNNWLDGECWLDEVKQEPNNADMLESVREWNPAGEES